MFGLVTEGTVADVTAAPHRHVAPDTLVGDDRGSHADRLFATWTDAGVSFVPRMKDNARVERVEAHAGPQHRHIVTAQTIRLTGTGAPDTCPPRLRRVAAIREDKGDTLVVLPNHHGLGASTRAASYKDRWQIEGCFTALTQTLKSKPVVGTSAKAVSTQRWTAWLSMFRLRDLPRSSRFGWSLANLGARLRMNRLPHRDLRAWLDEPFTTPPHQQEPPPALLAVA